MLRLYWANPACHNHTDGPSMFDSLDMAVHGLHGRTAKEFLLILTMYGALIVGAMQRRSHNAHGGMIIARPIYQQYLCLMQRI